MFELMVAIAIVESGLDPSPKTDPGPAGEVGILQITPICVKDVNRVLKLKKSKRRYTLEDRESVKKSFEMFKVYILHYVGDPDEWQHEREWQRNAARTWNGGPRFTGTPERARNTLYYWKKVRKALEEQNDV